jgi:hypothetical protein
MFWTVKLNPIGGAGMPSRTGMETLPGDVRAAFSGKERTSNAKVTSPSRTL